MHVFVHFHLQTVLSRRRNWRRIPASRRRNSVCDCCCCCIIHCCCYCWYCCCWSGCGTPTPANPGCCIMFGTRDRVVLAEDKVVTGEDTAEKETKTTSFKKLKSLVEIIFFWEKTIIIN